MSRRRKTAINKLNKQQMIWIALGATGLLILVPSLLSASSRPMAVSYLNKSGLPRGMRNNNPGNLVKTSRPWAGKIPHSQNTDSRFEQFKAYAYGVAAMIILLRDNYIKNGRNTIRSIMQRYAPPVENDTSAYANKVSKMTGWGLDVKIPTDKAAIKKLVQAMAYVENGREAVDDAMFNAAWKLT